MKRVGIQITAEILSQFCALIPSTVKIVGSYDCFEGVGLLLESDFFDDDWTYVTGQVSVDGASKTISFRPVP